METSVAISCKVDGVTMQFFAIEEPNAYEEGLWVCPRCKGAYLVTEGVVDALPDELKSDRNRELFAARYKKFVN